MAVLARGYSNKPFKPIITTKPVHSLLFASTTVLSPLSFMSVHLSPLFSTLLHTACPGLWSNPVPSRTAAVSLLSKIQNNELLNVYYTILLFTGSHPKLHDVKI